MGLVSKVVLKIRTFSENSYGLCLDYTYAPNLLTFSFVVEAHLFFMETHVIFFIL